MLNVTAETIEAAKKVIASKPVIATGYHIKIFPIPADEGLRAGEKEKYEQLAKLGFKATSERQKERETRGSDFAIVVNVGPTAWEHAKLEGGGQWAKEGQVIRYLRYAGLEFEEPPGSGNVYRIINDEDVLAYYDEVIHGN